MKIYIKDVVRLPKDTLYSFLHRVLNIGDNFHKAMLRHDTYFDPEFTKIQCEAHKRRSFDDIVDISKTYFKTSDKQVSKTILKFLKDDKNNLIFVLCNAAKKWVLNSDIDASYLKYCATYNNSYTKTDVRLNGRFCLDDIFKLMEIDKEFIVVDDDEDYDEDDDWEDDEDDDDNETDD